MAKYVGKRIVPKHCGEWDKRKDYEMLSVVMDTSTGDSYIARRAVPTGTAITDTAYWAKSSEWSQQIKNYSDQLTETLGAVKEDNAETKSAVLKDNAETKAAMSKELTETKTAMSEELASAKTSMSRELSETTDKLTRKVETADSDLNTARDELTKAKNTLNARMDSIAKGVTTDTEILDARVDAEGNTHESLGAAVRHADKTRGDWDGWLSNMISDVRNGATGRETKELTSDSVASSCLHPDGTIGEMAKETDTFWRVSEMIPVTAGRMYIITASSGWSQSYYVFYDSDGSVLSEETSPDDKSAQIIDRAVIAPPCAVNLRIGWIQSSTFTGKVREVTRFLFPTSELNGGADERVTTLESEMDKAQADILAAAVWEQTMLLGATVAEGETIEFAYTENRCISGATGEVSPLVAENNNFRVSDPIPVVSGELYAFTVSGAWDCYLYAFYDENDKLIGGFQEGANSIVEYADRITPVPAGAATVRIAWMKTGKGFAGTAKKVTALAFPASKLTGAAAEEASVRDSRITGAEQKLAEFVVDADHEYTLGDKLTGSESWGVVLDPDTGAVVKDENTNYRVSAHIAVKEYTPYRVNAAAKAGRGLYAFFDADGNYISGKSNAGETDLKFEAETVVAPARAATVRLACISGTLNCSMQEMKKGKLLSAELKWANRKWVCMGDSLTESNSRTSKHYFDYISEKTGIQTVNLGVSGTGYMNRQDLNKAFYQRVADIPEDADVITIFGSGNDLSHPLGTVTDTGTDTLCGCINTTIDAIYERIPLARLGIITPTPWIGSMPSKTTCSMAKYSEAIVEICRRRSIPCLDLYHESNLRPDDETFRKLAFSKDDGSGVHPDEKGHEIIAASFQSLLERLIL